MGKYIFAGVITVGIGVAHTAYNVWALRILWNTWLSEYFVLTVPVAIGVCLVGGWAKGYHHTKEEDKLARFKGYLEYEALQPIALVAISEVCRWYLG